MTSIPPWLMPGLDIVGNMTLAMLLGWVVGYERYFSGRAAGSQVYCLVSATSAAVTLLAGYPTLWYGGVEVAPGAADPTRVIGAILTGIGFLGAGLIVQSGLNVRGLTTAASIWGVAALGILVGVRFYVPAIGLAALFVIAVELLPRFERRLPARSAFSSTIRFREGYQPQVETVLDYLSQRGLRMPPDSMTLKFNHQRFELECLIFASDAWRSAAMSEVALELAALPAVDSFVMTRSSRA
ncbi:MgtC/SapB family protein [Massilia sp. PWRC2]|uniref:MgtC/SapB family protein n=1 Tax=Massilia sp. PWRC2 TaxID=2804626 RepID=UPI003CFBB01B